MNLKEFSRTLQWFFKDFEGIFDVFQCVSCIVEDAEDKLGLPQGSYDFYDSFGKISTPAERFFSARFHEISWDFMRFPWDSHRFSLFLTALQLISIDFNWFQLISPRISCSEAGCARTCSALCPTRAPTNAPSRRVGRHEHIENDIKWRYFLWYKSKVYKYIY